ncbi:hypothetical protein [Agrobacterium sp. CG674]
MPVMNNVANAMPADDLAALDAALADFDLDGDDDAIIEPDMSVESEELGELTLADVHELAATEIADEDTLADLDLKLEMQEGYQDQATTGSLEDLTNTAPAAVKPTKAAKAPKAPKAPKAAGVTRTPRDINAVTPEFFVTSGDVSVMSEEELADAKTHTMSLKPTQVKVAEKFENLFTALSVNKAPSKFTMIAFDALQKGTLTSTELVGAYKASGLGEGTARSQAGQMMNLFAAVRIADRSGQTLALRDDSLIAQRIRNLPAAAAA